ncbi:phage tail protein [Streptomyces luteireticuli]|uniref:phage tail protein n=1 Tax=Streptomyces luteireticuli TaxID=173858 RepID=UPI0035587CCD
MTTLVQSMRSGTNIARPFKGAVDGLGRSTQNLSNRTGALSTNMGKVKTPVQQVGRELKTAKTNADQSARAITKNGKAAGNAAAPVGKYGRETKGADRNSKGLNKTMKSNVIGMLLDLFTPLIEKVVAMASKSKTMKKIMRTAFSVIQKAVEKSMTVIKPIMKATGKLMDLVWKGIKLAIAPVLAWIVSDIPNGFRSVKDAAKAAWDSLPKWAQDVFKGILNAATYPLRTMIDLINSAIRAVNGIHVSVPSWVPLIGGKGFTINIPEIPNIPTFAEGGIVSPRSGGLPAIVAEAGESEAVMPLSKLDRLLTRTAVESRLASAGVGGPANGAGFHIENYYATQVSDPRETAMSLMFLAKARG